MEKPKHKSKNLLKRLMERFFFFPVDFVLQSTKSPEELLETMKSFTHEKPKNRFLLKSKEAEGAWQFELHDQTLNKVQTDYVTEQTLEGRIYRNEAGFSQVEGSVFIFPLLMLLPLLVLLGSWWFFSIPDHSSREIFNFGFLWLLYLVMVIVPKESYLLKRIKAIL
jgi:hypothetical protein